jgi:hypothetical protein
MTIESVGILVAIAGLILTIVVFIIQSRAQVRIQKADFVYRLNDKYDSICQFRSEHPEIMQFADSWSNKPLVGMDVGERAYFYYAGMTLGFLEIAVYSTFVSGILTKRDFVNFIRPMIVQEVAFNLPIFRDFAHNGYISQRSKDLLNKLVLEIESRNTNSSDTSQ